MGSFSRTCAVSNLPIEGGDPVRHFLITRNPYGSRGHARNITGEWFPRVWPLRAVYDDYGRARTVDDGPVKQVWLDGFVSDLIERGWGENSVHDVPVSKSMSFDELLDAVWADRVRVHRAESPSMPGSTPDVPVGVPTITRVRDAVVAAGFDDQRVMIDDDDGYGRIRIRCQLWEDDAVATLAELEPVLRAAGYACMLTCADPNTCELLVRPAPGVTDYYFVKNPLARTDECHPVYQVMIREDVWQALVAIPFVPFVGSEKTTASDARVEARAAWAALTQRPEFDDRFDEIDYDRSVLDDHGDFVADAFPYSVALGTHFRLIARRAREMDDDQIAEFLDSAGEFVHVQRVLWTIRYVWQPSHISGPGDSAWDTHRRFASVVASIARGEVKGKRGRR